MRNHIMACAIVALGSSAEFGLAREFPEYQSQDSAGTRLRSALVTSDNRTITDRTFARMIGNNVNFREAVFAFNQCYGGGFIDDLVARGLAGNVSYTSAARHNQRSYARSEDRASGVDPNFPLVRRLESTYSLHWATAAGGATPATVRSAANTARNNDTVGPVLNPTPVAPVVRRKTNPQYTSSGAAADAIKLHQGEATRFRAVLWGGSTQLDFGPALLNNPPPRGNQYVNGNIPANWNTLERMYNSLIAAGYRDNEIYVMYPGGERRNQQGNPTGTIFEGGPRLPNWVDDGTRYQDMRDAIETWAGSETNADTQFLFWSSFGHGSNSINFRNRQIPKALAYETLMDATLAQNMLAIHDYYADPAFVPSGQNPNPYFQVVTSVLAPELSITLNGVSLPLLDVSSDLDPFNTGGFVYKFALSRDDLLSLQNPLASVAVNYDFAGSDGGIFDQFADFIQELGPSTGNFANGIGVPAPGAAALLAVVGLGLARRRRH
ncbi:MAG: hypothetical protein SFZ23_10185 [Planctomycetota bacterium]|nr:hypothetical protein [Planctomycetota bacterium]